MRTERLIGALVADLGMPVADVSSELRHKLPFAALIVGAGFLSIMGVRGDVLATGLSPTVGKLGLGCVFIALGLAAAVRLSHPEQRSMWPRLILLAVPLTAAAVVGADFALEAGPNWGQRLFGKSFIACLMIIPLLAALPLGVAVWCLRQGATSAPMTTGALAGIGSAGIAIVAYGLYCNEDAVPFVATWYVLAGCLVAAAGAICGRLVLRW